MVLPDPTALAIAASLVVALVTAAMAVLGWRSYKATDNPRLVFVVLAFALFALKSLFVAYNVQTHVVGHDSIEFFSALFDVGIVVLFFMPFVVRGSTV
jgi:uncharacterized membrane protein YfcA